jgi:hypothetical protein
MFLLIQSKYCVDDVALLNNGSGIWKHGVAKAIEVCDSGTTSSAQFGNLFTNPS